MKIDVNKVRISQDIRWIAEIDCIKIMPDDSRSITIINYPEAVLWDLILQRYSSGKMFKILATIKRESEEKSAVWVENIFNDWINKGFVTLV
jgi:hypothetical protein